MPSARRTEAPSRLACPDGWMVLYDVETTGKSASSHIVDIYMIAVHIPSGRMREVRLAHTAPRGVPGLDVSLAFLTSGAVAQWGSLVRPPTPPSMDASDMHGLTWRFLINEQPFHQVVFHLMAFLRSLRALHDDPLYMLAHTGAHPPAVDRDRAKRQPPATALMFSLLPRTRGAGDRFDRQVLTAEMQRVGVELPGPGTLRPTHCRRPCPHFLRRRDAGTHLRSPAHPSCAELYWVDTMAMLKTMWRDAPNRKLETLYCYAVRTPCL